MLKDRISLRQINELACEVANSLQQAYIRRGLDYLNRGNVYNVVINDAKVQATVQGTYRYLVNIYLDKFHLSTCSCPVHKGCKHIAATFLYLYSIYDRPEKFLQQIKTYATRRLAERETTAPNAPDMLLTPKETNTAEEWHQYFIREFDLLDIHRQKIYLYGRPVYTDFLSKITGHARSWPAPAKELYLFHARLFTMLRIEHNGEDPRLAYYLPDYSRDGVARHTAKLYEEAEKCCGGDTLKDYADYFRTALKMLRQELLRARDRYWFDWLHIYRAVWSGIQNRAPWLMEEEARLLDELLEKRALPQTARYRITVARAHMALLEGGDKKFMQVMDRAPLLIIGDIAPYLRAFQSHKEWERLAGWLRWLMPRMNDASYQDFQYICLYWTELAGHPPFREEVLQALKSWLPGSSHFYSQSLVRAGQYKTWVNYHISAGNLPENIDPQELRQVEKADLFLLLPLYHHFIMRWIYEKKRPAYINAVKMLKKLQTCYKKLKRDDDWRRYITGLAGRCSRMRAFQEELRKGKLIS